MLRINWWDGPTEREVKKLCEPYGRTGYAEEYDDLDRPLETIVTQHDGTQVRVRSGTVWCRCEREPTPECLLVPVGDGNSQA